MRLFGTFPFSHVPSSTGFVTRSGRSFRIASLLAAMLFTGLQTGCAVFESGQEMMRQSFRVFTPRQTDYRDVSQEEEDNWEFVGQEARGDRPLESQNDPIRDLLMSPKAKSIERNLGYE